MASGAARKAKSGAKLTGGQLFVGKTLKEKKGRFVLLSRVAHLVDTKIEESYYKSQHTGSFSKRRKKRARCADSYELRFRVGRKCTKIEGRVARLMGTLFPKLPAGYASNRPNFAIDRGAVRAGQTRADAQKSKSLQHLAFPSGHPP